jgi:hypothetical protein
LYVSTGESLDCLGDPSVHRYGTGFVTVVDDAWKRLPTVRQGVGNEVPAET